MKPVGEVDQAPVVTDPNSPTIEDCEYSFPTEETGFFEEAIIPDSPGVTTRLINELYPSLGEEPGVSEHNLGIGAGGPILKQTSHLARLERNVDTLFYSESASNSTNSLSQKSSGPSIPTGDASPPKVIVGTEATDPAQLHSTMDWTGRDDLGNDDSKLFGPLGDGLGLDPMTDALVDDSDLTLTDQAMENNLNFESAGDSPTPFGLAMPANTSTHSDPSTAGPLRSPEGDGSAMFTKNASPLMFSLNTSRENSPFSSTMLASHEQSPAPPWSNHSPVSNLDETFNGITMNGPSPENLRFQQNGNLNFSGIPAGLADSSVTPSSTFGKDFSSPPVTLNSSEGAIPPTLTIEDTPLKSRVETQIPISMWLNPLPQGVTKLHLPPYTISKPKLLAKQTPAKSSDTLELHTSLVCTSAMQDPANLTKALARARGEYVTRSSDRGPQKSPQGSSSPEEDQDKPLNGGEVKICQGCVLRERKRAARKKLRKVEEEELWQKHEEKRVVVFNCAEIREWSDPLNEIPSGYENQGRSGQPQPGAMSVMLPMRIACYCRHQNEKMGFRVIFTIKDHQDKAVAQQITNSIMITDDHKTHAAPPPMVAPSPTLPDGTHLPGAGVFSTGLPNSLEMLPGPTLGPTLGVNPVRPSYSTPNLAALQRDFSQQFPLVSQPFAQPLATSTASSNTLTPRNLSRPASPAGLGGPSTKRRKQSGSGKLPSGLTMTRIETSQMPQFGENPAPASAAVSPYPLQLSNNAMGVQDRPPFGQKRISNPFNASPPTPNSNDNSYFSAANHSQSSEGFSGQRWISAPSSAHPSRPGSPNGPRSHFQDVAQVGQALNSHLWGDAANHNTRPPVIHKVIPSEGSVTGGQEVTLLGSGFYQGLEVCFGNAVATTTTYWGKKCLHCLTPPAARPGTVQVWFKHDHPQFSTGQHTSPMMQRQQILYNYTDDREQEMMRLALNIVGGKMTGHSQDPLAFARQIITTQQWHMPSSVGNGGQQRGASNSPLTDQMDLETSMLRCLEFIDLDDGPLVAKYDLKRPTGQTLLHYASSLGFARLVAGLLVRRADPDALDNNGLTPMHFAAMYGQDGIIGRLRRAGANPTIRSLRNYIPLDLAISPTTRQAFMVSRDHLRSLSVGSTPMRSFSRQMSVSTYGDDSDESSEGSIDLDSDHDGEIPRQHPLIAAAGTPKYRTPPRRGSGKLDLDAQVPLSPASRDVMHGLLAPPEFMVAWRDQLATQIHQFQQIVNWLPNLPALPPMPAIPDYQASPMIRRISALVPHRAYSPRGPDTRPDSRWWDFLGVTKETVAPPAYEEIFGTRDEEDLNVEKPLAVQAAGDTVIDSNFERTEAGSTKTERTLVDVKIGRNSTSKESQDQLRTAHAQQVKKIRSDWTLFLIWIPLLVAVLVTMLRNFIPDAWHSIVQFYGYAVQQYHDRVLDRVF